MSLGCRGKGISIPISMGFQRGNPKGNLIRFDCEWLQNDAVLIDTFQCNHNNVSPHRIPTGNSYGKSYENSMEIPIR